MKPSLLPLVCMNILHLVTADRAKPSSTIKKLKRACELEGTCPGKYDEGDENDLRARLTPLQYRITQERGTEKAFTGKYVHWDHEGLFTCVVCGNHLFTSDTKFDSQSGWPSFSDVVSKGGHRSETTFCLVAFTGKYVHWDHEGLFTCVVCGNHLFTSDTKFDSQSGWPSFYDVVSKGNIMLRDDTSHDMVRTEVTCGKCGAHLGHMFNDGPRPTGLRYCINSGALDFVHKLVREDRETEELNDAYNENYDKIKPEL